jgi:transcriptional regulator
LTFYPNGCILVSDADQDNDRIALLQGTLDLLILRTLVFGPQHGQGIARSIQSQSETFCLWITGSLYPALQRLEDKKWIAAEWGTSENNRKARFYTSDQDWQTATRERNVAMAAAGTAMSRVLEGEA